MRHIHKLITLAIFAALSARAAAQALDPDPPTPTRDLSAQISAYVRCIFQDKSGHLWFGTNSDGVCRYNGQSLDYLSTKDGLAGNAVRKILQTADGAMWFATDGGVSRYHLDKFTNYTVADGLTDNNIWSMMLDKGGTIWVGTHGGVCRFDGKSFVPFPIPAAKVENPSFRFGPKLVWSMFEDRDGNLWFGTDGEGARKYDGKSFTTYTTRDGLAGNEVRCIIGDRQGRIWLGTEGGGVSRYDGTGFQNFTRKDGLGNDRVYTMLEDRAGNLWFSTLAAGVTRYDGKAFTVFRELPDLPRTHVQSMLQDKDGTLWFGCSGGLFRFDGTSFINVTRNGPWREPALPNPAPMSDSVPDPMAKFARLVGGEWKVTFASGTSAVHAWQWGPGKYSMRRMSNMSSAVDNPWAGEVIYWHPGRKEVCLLGMHDDVPGVGRGVSEGTITFTGETTDAVINLFQPRGPRKLGQKQIFDGPDQYHEILLEQAGPDGMQPLAEWDFVRIKEPSDERPRTAEAAPPKLSKHLKDFAALLGHTWESKGDAKGEWAAGNDFHLQSTFEWVESLEVIFARVVAPARDGEATTLLEAIIYHHLAADVVRCLALSSRGDVYEGELTVLEGGGLQFDLKGYSGEQVVTYGVSFDFEKDESLRQRIWSLKDTERTLLLDVQHRKLEPKKE